MKWSLRVTVPLLSFCLLAGCESISQAPPPVTSDMVKKSGKLKDPAARQMRLTELQNGRILFGSRCIECHTLPPVWHYTNQEWPRIIDSMAERAQLKSEERDAMVAYILAARVK